jgi:hypothetical protein
VSFRSAPWVAAVIAAFVGCTSPTLPLPPPAIPIFSSSSVAGKVHLASERGAEPNAIVIVYNRNPAVPLDERVSGAQADGDGSWDADVIASGGDYLDVSQHSGGTMSPSITVRVPR